MSDMHESKIVHISYDRTKPFSVLSAIDEAQAAEAQGLLKKSGASNEVSKALAGIDGEHALTIASLIAGLNEMAETDQQAGK